MRGRATTVYITMRGRGTRVYGMSVRAMRVYGIMRARAM